MPIAYTPQECLGQIADAETKVTDYENKYKIWDDKYKVLLADWTRINNDVNAEDIKLYNWIINEFNTNTVEEKSKATGDNVCIPHNCQGYKPRYTTPNGRSLTIKINGREELQDIIANCQGGPCSYNCYCRILSNNSMNYFNNEKNKIYQLIAKREAKVTELNNLSRDMPQPDTFHIKCCLNNNEIKCNRGKCVGNIQICRLENINKIGTLGTDTERKNRDDIDNIKTDINKILDKIKDLSDNINDETAESYKKIEQTDITKIISDLKDIDNNLKVSINKVSDIIKDVENKKNQAIILDNLTKTTSSFKENITDNLSIINTYITSINDNISNINENYSTFKKLLDNIINEDLNLTLLNTNKIENNIIINNLNDYITKFNNLIDTANTLNSTSQNDLDELLKLYNNSINLKKIFDDEKIILDNNYNSLVDIFNKFNENDTLFYNYEFLTFNELKNNIININTKINNTKITEKINSLNNKYLQNKKEYEELIIKQEIEEQQKKIDDDILLLKLIENNNQITTPLEISNNNIIEKPVNIESQNYMIYIIIGVILISFFILKK